MKLLFNLLCSLLCSLCLAQNNIETKFTPPIGYERIYNDNYSKFLRQFPLKSNNEVKYYNGDSKLNSSIWAAVFDYDIGTSDLHQCADAVIYMRANYLYKYNLIDKLHFNFTSGFKAYYKDWLLNYYKVKGNNVWLQKRSNNLVDSLGTFKKWLRQIWIYAGTYSLEKELKEINIKNIKPGDVFIKGGFPGHAVAVVDVVVNSNNEKLYMLSQSFMPAQENHILLNPKNNSVWYKVDGSNVIYTPEYSFESNQLKRFKN